ncbi:heme biosynthesis HemY N-terminal domain-containing protein [Bermanella sp. WJH001]|uniref:heme biosynthesis HemY N-terminal domain-containing protein n=1 Tax=Bermanella sp. WJH001 TaxID=3048005 RepID=UPI0024BDA67A|nr:heme biosynthesis HemY N-terminal domain-containing protein [Bermanella sp. WJH001]MDJ1538742.1 heme biosynthesis HemY N-terminal domain-containing protein [Bermanella sp. WJH001]
MSKRLLLIILLLLGGTLLGHYMLQGSGYVLVSFQNWVLETSLWVFLIILAGSVFTIYAAIHIVITIMGGPSLLKNWHEKRGINTAIGKTVRGLIYLAEGNFKQSEKLLMAGAHGKGKIINYLAAARAAQMAGNFERSDELMAQAVKSTKGAELAVGLQQAQLQLEREQFEQCLATCLRLQKQFPKHQYVNKMLLKAHMALEDWQAVIELLPSLNKHKLLPNKKFQKLEVEAYGKLIEHMIRSRNTASKDPKALLDVWKNIPTRTIKEMDFLPLAHAFIEHLIHLGAQQEAEAQLRYLLQHHFSDELMSLYGWVKGKDVKRQLLFAQDQLKQRPNDAVLLLSLGRIALMNELFDDAQAYLEASLAQENSAEVRSELSRLYLANNENEKAIAMLRQGLGLDLPDLPLPH